ncbi:hypothetical protein [Brachybacterium sp. GPGPB12]|uniref:hypothetical protein n=1 Tax=Brachybacterium sp. GPGPB12 TaxID=3023517 RepID=UPI0031345720
MKVPTRSATGGMLVINSAACGTISTSPISGTTIAIAPSMRLAPGWRRPKRARSPSSERGCGRRVLAGPSSEGTRCIRERP